MAAMPGPIVISSDEINCLIYSYFQDAGFNHSAFALRNEGRLQNSTHFTKHIPRGELIELLTKSLLYIEVESHWRGDELATNCKTGFSLLEPHLCSLEDPQTNSVSESIPPTEPPTSQQTKNGMDRRISIRNGPAPPPDMPVHEQVLQKQKQSLAPSPADNVPTKRKTSPVPTDDGHVEKRQRRTSDDMEVDSVVPANSEVVQTSSDNASYDNFTGQKYVTKVFVRPQGPGDQTDPRVALMLPGHKSEVFVCAFNPKRHNLLASGSKDSVVNLWDLPDPPSDGFAQLPGEPLVLEDIAKSDQGDLTSLDWNPDGTLLAVGSYDSVLRVCTVEGSVYFSHGQHQGPIFTTQFSKNSEWLLTASLDGTACLWHVKGKRLHRQYRHHKDCCLDVEWLNNEMFASAGADQRIFIMHADDDEPIKVLNGHKDEINQIRVNPAGTRLASCSDDGTAYIWRIDNIKHPSEEIPGLSTSDHVAVILKGHTHSVSTVSWCVDRPAGSNELIATSSFDGTARLWDSVTGECLHIFKDHKRPLYALKFSPDGRFFATGSGDGWLHIYYARAHHRIFSWFAGTEKPGVFEIDWQEHNGISRIALALECREVAVLDLTKIEAFKKLRQSHPPSNTRGSRSIVIPRDAKFWKLSRVNCNGELLCWDSTLDIPIFAHVDVINATQFAVAMVLFTPAGELVSVASEPIRPKDEIRILVGVTGEVWQETQDHGCGMVESDLGRIIVLPVDGLKLEAEPLMLLALNATDAVEWEDLDNRARALSEHLAKPLSKFRDLLCASKSIPSTAATSPAPLRV